MTYPNLPTDDRTLDLLALRAVEGIDAESERMLGGDALCEDFDTAAAVLAIGFMAEAGLESPPASLLGRLESVAGEYTSIDSADSRGPASTTTPSTDHVAGRIEPKPQRGESHGDDAVSGRQGSGPIGAIGLVGWLAAAACLAFAMVTMAPERAPSAAESLALLESRSGIVKTSWLGLDDASLSDSPHQFDVELSGEVIWDEEANEGFMVFEGLAENVPTEYQYQLWIFDADRPTGQLPQHGDGILSQRPVDGGVFDADASGRVIVPIDAKLSVGKAAVFAITVELPGGVVVSDRDIVTLALVE
ncbi:MAG: anti-sigma factor [Phycisphaerales bacterium]